MCELTDRQIGLLRSLIRVEVRRNRKAERVLRQKYGDNYEPAKIDERRAFLYEVYEALGGDPENIAIMGGR